MKTLLILYILFGIFISYRAFLDYKEYSKGDE